MTAEKSERKAIMEIKLHDIPEQIVHCMRDGKGDTHKQTFEDDYARIMIISLDPGASIGPHTHETNYEIFYGISGTGKVLYEGTEEPMAPGVCHYCPQGTQSQLGQQRQRAPFGVCHHSQARRLTEGK